MQAKHPTDQLIRQLEEIIASIKLIEQTLSEEFHVIASNDWQQLINIIDNKKAQLDTIRVLETSIKPFCQHTHPIISTLLRTFTDSVKSCQIKNQKNLQLVAVKLRQTTQLMQILQGVTLTHGMDTYNAFGQTNKVKNTNEVLII